MASAPALLALVVLARLSGVADFRAYPEVHASLGAGTLVLGAALALAALAPFLDRRGIDL